MLQRTFCLVAIGAAAGCTTTATSVTEITVTPADATIRIEGFGECRSPCRVEIDQPRQISVAKEGYKTQSLSIAPRQKRVAVTLDLAAPTKDVDSGALPDLK